MFSSRPTPRLAPSTRNDPGWATFIWTMRGRKLACPTNCAGAFPGTISGLAWLGGGWPGPQILCLQSGDPQEGLIDFPFGLPLNQAAKGTLAKQVFLYTNSLCITHAHTHIDEYRHVSKQGDPTMLLSVSL